MTGPDPNPIPGPGRGVAPSYDGRGIGNVAASLAQALGFEAPDLLPPLSADVLPPELAEGAETVVLLAVDGLGQRAYEEARPDLEALPRLADEGAAAPLTSVLPSTTATALTTLHLGAAPARHGLVAPVARLREHGVTASLLRWRAADRSGDLAEMGVAVEDVVRAPALPQVLPGIEAAAVTRDQYVDSPLSQVLYRGADVRGYEGLPDLTEAVREAAASADLVLAYWDGLDATGHLRGPDDPAWDEELVRIDEAIGALAADLPDDTLLLVTSDHGFVPTPKPLALGLDDHPDLLDLCDGLPTGEVRWRFVATDEPGALREYVDDRLGHALDVVDQASLLEAGAYGPEAPEPALRERYGDLVLVPRGNRSVAVRYGDEPPPHLAGHHGGATEEEMLVPLIAARTPM
jgi:hypothetical protein